MFMIVLTVLETATHHKSLALNSAPLAIGMSFVICILAFGPVSSGSFNPARSLGPALLSGNLKHLWIYIFAPILGAQSPGHLLQPLCYT
ncbi:MAG: hypothetical protein HC767_13515 [Akkermansiaceae bacterium]|nr:hypothetical protein [Akkermansiaceae bacterium]